MTETATTTVAVRPDQPALTPFQVIEQVITKGDIGQMRPEERVAFYWRTCESLGLNPLTRPFEFISLNGKLVMYARKDATDQLRKLNAVTVTEIRREKDDELGTYTVYAHGVDRTGREDEASGVVFVKGLGGETLANALMKAETKAKRRLTLSLVGLGFLDESEVEGADAVDVDPTTGVIRERAKPASLIDRVKAQQAALEGGETDAGVAQQPERGAPSVEGAGSTPAPRSTSRRRATKPPAEKPADDVVEGKAIEVSANADMSFETEAKADAVDAAAAAPAEPAPLTGVEFMQRVGAAGERGVTHALVVDVARELFPGVSNLAALADTARGQLWSAIEQKLADAGR